jgi:hypothetical protein
MGIDGRYGVSRMPSTETRLRTLQREHKLLQQNYALVRGESTKYRERATKAEQECAEWKRRFDLLLSREQPETTQR